MSNFTSLTRRRERTNYTDPNWSCWNGGTSQTPSFAEIHQPSAEDLTIMDRIDKSPRSPVPGSLSPVRKIDELHCCWESFVPVNPMQSDIWHRACAEVFSEGEILIVTSGARAEAVAPLSRSVASRYFSPIGAELYEPTEFAYTSPSAAEQLAEALFQTGVPIFIGDMFADSVMLPALQKTYRHRLVLRPRPGHPCIDLDESWAEPESHLNPGRRSDMRRARRRAEELGVVQCDIIEPTTATVDQLLDEAYRVEAASWKGREGSALALDTRVGGFYRAYALAACARGLLRIALMRIGGRAVAMQLAIQQGHCFWLFKMGFDEEFSRCSPGALLIIESLKYATGQGCSRYELMGDKEPWNQMWTRQVHASVALRLHARGAGGLVMAAIDRSRSVAVRWVREHHPR